MPNHYARPLHERFRPVHLRARADGWTVERQRGFIRGLGEGLSTAHAARAVGMTERSANRLRARDNARSFAKAWATALSLGGSRCATQSARGAGGCTAGAGGWCIGRWCGTTERCSACSPGTIPIGTIFPTGTVRARVNRAGPFGPLPTPTAGASGWRRSGRRPK